MHKYVHVMICHCQGLSAAGVSLQSANFVGPHSIALIFSTPQSLRNRFFFHRYLNRGRGTTRHTSQTRGTTRFIFFFKPRSMNRRRCLSKKVRSELLIEM